MSALHTHQDGDLPALAGRRNWPAVVASARSAGCRAVSRRVDLIQSPPDGLGRCVAVGVAEAQTGRRSRRSTLEGETFV